MGRKFSACAGAEELTSLIPIPVCHTRLFLGQNSSSSIVL